MHDLMDEGDMEETEKINVVPLADLTLVLLIILMVLSPMISQSMIRVSTPQVQATGGGTVVSEEQAEEKIPLLIAISERGYFLNNVLFENLDPLLGVLRAKLKEDGDRPVIVSADDGVVVKTVVAVLDGARLNGAQEVSLVKSLTPEKKK